MNPQKFRRLPPLNQYTVKLYWLALSMAGILLAWSFFYQWPPMTRYDKAECTALLIMGCTGILYRGMQMQYWDELKSWFWSFRAALSLGACFPAKDTPMAMKYRAGLGAVLLDMTSQLLFTMGCIKKMPWGWLLLLMHAVFTFGVEKLKTQKPEWFDESDPDLAGTAYLTLPALDFVIAGIAIVLAWFF